MFYAVDSASFHELGFASGFSIWLLCHILRKHFLLCAGSTPGPSEIGGIPQTMPDKVYEVCLSPSLQPEKRLWFSALHQIAQFWRIQDCSRRLLQNWCGKSSLQVGSHLKDKAMWNLWTPCFNSFSLGGKKQAKDSWPLYYEWHEKPTTKSQYVSTTTSLIMFLCGFPAEMLLWSCPWYCWDPSHLATVARWTCIGPWTQTQTTKVKDSLVPSASDCVRLGLMQLIWSGARWTSWWTGPWMRKLGENAETPAASFYVFLTTEIRWSATKMSTACIWDSRLRCHLGISQDCRFSSGNVPSSLGNAKAGVQPGLEPRFPLVWFGLAWTLWEISLGISTAHDWRTDWFSSVMEPQGWFLWVLLACWLKASTCQMRSVFFWFMDVYRFDK